MPEARIALHEFAIPGVFPGRSTSMKSFLALLFIGVSAYAQPADGTFHFTSPQTRQSMQEAATILRTVADLPKVSIDDSTASLTFQGPAPQVGMAEWILRQLDTPGNENALLEYKAPDEYVVRVNFLAHVNAARPMQEMLTVLRTVADVQRIFNFTSRQAIVMRAKPSDMAFAEWIVDQLNVPADQKPDGAPRVYPNVTPHNMVARVNYLAYTTGSRNEQALLSVMRNVADIAKIFNYSAPGALILRAPESDIARAEWLIQELDQPAGPQNAGTQVYRSATADDVTRVFFLANATEQQLNAALAAVRTDAKISKLYYTVSPAALVVRGTTDQVNAAEQTVARRNGLALLR
jgi:hypothetical protein